MKETMRKDEKWIIISVLIIIAAVVIFYVWIFPH